MFKRTDINIRKLADGSVLSIPVFTFEGQNPLAPRVYIQSSIHGAEVQGNGVIIHLIDHFIKHPPQGTVVLVPNVNPFAINQRLGDYGYSRFDPSTGDNWNRLYTHVTCRTVSEKTTEDQIVIEQFLAEIDNPTNTTEIINKLRTKILNCLDNRLERSNSYGQKLALQIQRMASEADIVLDLHCDTVSLPHLYTPTYAVDSARALNLPYLIAIPEEFKGALDEASFCPWSNLASVWNNPNYTRPHVEAFTLEFGSQESLNLSTAKQQAYGIIHYLATKQVCSDISYNPMHKQHVCLLKDFYTIYAPQGGYIIQSAPLGTMIKENEPLLEILQIADLNCIENVKANQSLIESLTTIVRAPTACIPIVQCCSTTVHEGMVAMKVLKV